MHSVSVMKKPRKNKVSSFDRRVRSTIFVHIVFLVYVTFKTCIELFEPYGNGQAEC